MKKFLPLFCALVISVQLQAQVIRPEIPVTNGFVSTIVKQGNVIYIGGNFTSIISAAGTQIRNHLAAFDATTGTVLPWNPNANDWVSSLAVNGNTIYAAGSFTSLGGINRKYIGAIDAATGAIMAWNPGSNALITTMVANANRVYIAGNFLFTPEVGGGFARYLAGLDATTGLNIHSADSDAGSNELALYGGRVYVGGGFTSLGVTRFNIGALDVNTGNLLPWYPQPGTNASVLAFGFGSNTVYAGGGFTSIGGQPRNYIAALDATTAMVTPWSPNANGSVTNIVVDGNTVYTSGNFSVIGGQSRNKLAALDAVTGQSTTWNPNPNGNIEAILVDGNTVYVGGGFTTIAGQPRSFLAALSTLSIPVLNCPGTIMASNALNQCSQTISFAATASGTPEPALTYKIGNTTITSPYNFPVGTTLVTATASNSAGATSCNFNVTVNDVQGPSVNNLSLSPNQLGVTNHKLKDVVINYISSDNCSQPVSCQLTVASNEAINGSGDGNTMPDWIIVDDHHIKLRAERSGKGNGRIYTIIVTCRDQYGNSGSRIETVTVGHNPAMVSNAWPEQENITTEMEVKILSHPSQGFFDVQLPLLEGNKTMQLKLYDLSGRLMEQREGLSQGTRLRMGETVQPGIYMLEIITGTLRKQMKLVMTAK